MVSARLDVPDRRNVLVVMDLILPCLDESQALPWILDRIPTGIRPIVVDNGSTDSSPEIAERLGATVVRCRQRGYGAACHAGLLASAADLVAFCDCDGSIDPSQLNEFAAPVRSGDADLVISRRRPVQRGVWPVHARLANATLAWWLRRRAGLHLHDIGPLRVARRRELLDLAQTDRRSGYPLETVVLAAQAGWRIVETDVDYRPRAGRSKVTGTVRGATNAVRDMSAVLRR
jgi:glycosyltransferase involved in cell wall biosynthesis